MAAAGVLDLALHGHDAAAAEVVAAADRLRDLQDDQPWGQPYAPADGWDWGSNGRILDNLVVLAIAHELTGRSELLAAATRGLDYLLGGNALGQSYVTGYGTDFTRHQRTRHFAHDLDPALPASAGRRARRWPDLQGPSGLSVRPAAGGPAAAAPLPRRADVGDDERRLHPLERAARLDRRPVDPVSEPFPTGFKFGASSAAYQIEGATAEDGRGESIWDRFCRVPGAVAGGATGDRACDHYHRWREDLDLMAALRLETYRFSIAWPRVQPDGRGPLNGKGVDFYRRLASGLRERGIDPVATLYHGDLPAALQDRGGWAARETAARFAEHAGRMADALGDIVGHWITHNEPWGVAFLGHAEGTKAPGLRDWPTALQVAHHLLLSHGLAVRALRTSRADATVGITLNLAPVRAASSSPADVEAARREDGHVNRWFLDPLLRGGYPDDLAARYEQRVGSFEIHDGDLETIATPIDVLGINYYHPAWVRAARAAEPLGLEHVPPPPPTSPLGWQIDPQGLRELLARLVRDYGRRPIWITENGIPGDSLDDHARVDYLAAHLEALGAAIADGADVRRYFVWSFLDSFEWELGYGARFGLVHVDFETQRRTLKRSARWYRDRIARAR